MTNEGVPEREIRFTPAFKRNLRQLAKKYRHIRQDIQPLLDTLLAGSYPGDQIPDIGVPVYKVRAHNTDAHRGKRGGYRIIYTCLTPTTIILVTVYSKSDQQDIAPHTIRTLIEADVAASSDQDHSSPATDHPLTEEHQIAGDVQDEKGDA